MEKGVEKKLEVESAVGGEVSEAVKTWNTLEPEMTMKILTYLYSSDNRKEILEKRLVCKLWRDVIDNNFDFQAVVNDEKYDVTLLSHLRVGPTAHVTSLQEELNPDLKLFKNVSNLKCLKISGRITTTNFQLLLKETSNLEQLSLSNATFIPIDPIESAGPPEVREGSLTNQVWNKLTHLEILDLSYDAYLMTFLISMENLTSLKLLLGISVLQDMTGSKNLNYLLTRFSSFLEGTPNLKCIDFTSHLHLHKSNCPILSFVAGQKPIVFKAGKQMETIRLSIPVKFLSSWLPFIDAQLSLQQIQIEALLVPEWNSFRPFDEIGGTLEANRDTLTSIDFGNFSLTSNLDAGLFGGMMNLKELRLRLLVNESVDTPFRAEIRNKTIFNLATLPKSIEVLTLEGISCWYEDFNEMIGNLENLKHVELINLFAPTGRIGRIALEGFACQPKIQTLVVSPVSSLVLAMAPPGLSDGQCLIAGGHKIEILKKEGALVEYFYVNHEFERETDK